MPRIAQTPPMGWNSRDCFGVSVTEAEVKANADYMAERLKQYGWEYVVVDLGWYAPSASKDDYKLPRIDQLIDDYGRLIPDPVKFPSAADGSGFRPLADYVHSLGLKFGIHIMRGIPWQAVERNTPILGSQSRAADIAQPENLCPWYKGMYGVNMTRDGGQAWYNSLLELYSQWDVDFIKADDLNSWDGGDMTAPYHTDEIEGVHDAIERTGRPIVLSLSPGAALVCNARHLRRNVNMFRISCDFWDDWETLRGQFERCERWAPYAVPGCWPDADMLPFGKIGIRGEVGQPRLTRFTENEQYTLMTLWSIVRSPLMFGGHLPEADPLSIELITNEEVLTVNQASSGGWEVHSDQEQVIWLADAREKSETYLALFNLREEESPVRFDLSGRYEIRDLWRHEDLGIFEGHFAPSIGRHGAGLYRLRENGNLPLF